jgi:hypothetical protein
MPMRRSPSRRSMSWPASSTTRVTIRPAVRQATHSSSATATREVCTASHAAVSSKARVHHAPCRAHGTAATITHGQGNEPGARRPPGTPAPRQGPAHASGAGPRPGHSPSSGAGKPHSAAGGCGSAAPWRPPHRRPRRRRPARHGVLDTQQPLPYPCRSHAVPPPGNPALSSRKPNGGAACSHARAAQATHGSVTRASFRHPHQHWVAGTSNASWMKPRELSCRRRGVQAPGAEQAAHLITACRRPYSLAG